MATVEIHAKRMSGPWIEAFVLDRHVVSSQPIGYVGDHLQFDTTRSPLGELVYQLKYKGGPPGDIIETVTTFATEHWSGKIDCVVSPPPSLQRARQPAEIVAEGVAGSLGVFHKVAAVVKASTTPQMKNVTPQERTRLLGAAIQPGADAVAGMRVLIVDDLWETGSTMRRVAEVLGAMGASEIRALAMTQTK